MSNTINNNPGVRGFSLPSFGEIKESFASGLRSIGAKLAEFGGKISDGFASIFSGLGRTAANAGNNAYGVTGGPALLATGKPFSAQEKADLMAAARQSPFFQSLDGGKGTFSKSSFENIAEAVLDTPRSVAGMRAHGVTLDEAVAISMYSSQAYTQVNDALRNGGDAKFVALGAAFASGLARLPSFDGNPVQGPNGQTYHQCWRGAKLPDTVGRAHMPGQTVSDPGIMSSTMKQSEKFNNVNYDMILLLKPGSEGKDISGFSDKPTEYEVAFPPNVQFSVVSRDFEHPALDAAAAAAFHPGYDLNNQAMGNVKLVMREI